MVFDFLWIGLGLAALGYFIGEGLRNFKSETKRSVFDSFREDDEHELIKETDVHWFIGVTKDDAKSLIEEYPDIPHIKLNGKVYYPKSKLREWLLKIGEDLAE